MRNRFQKGLHRLNRGGGIDPFKAVTGDYPQAAAPASSGAEGEASPSPSARPLHGEIHTAAMPPITTVGWIIIDTWLAVSLIVYLAIVGRDVGRGPANDFIYRWEGNTALQTLSVDVIAAP